MEKHIKEKFNKGIKKLAMKAYGIQENQITLLDGFESYMFEYQKDGEERILRIGHSSRRSIEMVHGEVDWINFLSRNGVNSAHAIISMNKKLVEEIADGHGGNFLATSFIKAKGGHANKGNWQAPLWAHYGEQLGRMNQLSRNYAPPHAAWKRPEWNSPENLDILPWIPVEQKKVIETYKTLVSYLESLPQSQENYGLIHQDLHSGNFFVDAEGQIMIFDFDDSCYGWFAYDLAMVIFYASMREKVPEIFAENFLAHFMKGYRRETSISSEWLSEIPYFLKLREIDLYAVIYRSFDMNNLKDPWAKNYMDGRREKIENEIPYLDLDFSII